MSSKRFSGETLSFGEINEHHLDVILSLKKLYSSEHDKFVGYTKGEIVEEFNRRRNELERTSIFTCLSSIEGFIRMDYLGRCYKRKKDPMSRELRKLFKKKGERARLKDDILKIWKGFDEYKQIASEVNSAFKYRDWIAHGRYWIPKLGRRYDFFGIFTLALQIESYVDLN